MIYLAIVTLAIYLYYIRVFYTGLSAEKLPKNYDKNPVSVIVAARNEQHNIANLLLTLSNQTYPQNRYEIIIANDGSTDNTKEIVESYANRFDNIKLIDVQNRETAISPKKNALTQAIQIAQNDILLLTDADCIVNKGWIESMVGNFTDETQMVAGFSRTKLDKWNNANLAQKFEFFDIIAIFSAAAGSIRKDKYFSCSGQNIGYRKSAFESVGGFEKIKHLLSGDDVNLMQLFRRSKFKIRFSFHPKSFVFTKPVSDWKELINQRSRWASNMKFQIELNPEFFIYLISFSIFLFSAYYSLFSKFEIAFILLAIKGIADYLFIQKSFKLFRVNKERLSFFINWIIIQPFYIVVVAVFGQLNLFKWHGKKQ